ncbi:restriction endonuclease subunit S [Listeria cossartiae subsp. cayugensis]|uniref:Restriction endonuclease subunit S n=1 Tax=Listeria cossartiae subsp. cayugensis TaxID=2713505 RepID=A0ABU2IMJ0_9LIST|nr:restriction endonuclease subunit S [Listeria cossartiae]MDT0049403.1 restriction endonuclease subunit S [Listeria cossartiae subsp. cayugensis]MDT0065906.1 restriction endonuclease subunit S [Listeria cossartiae subsp. cayugensis]MDT0078490.1 restriction endonuclease subunit S [Listeria cossartiae subsp. cayugensis]MDT0081326.1 restriction endonuclease subunit S [Listeria cossartiae subsp. cayugensis]MDT0088139.1 restriction endonuclease subunit S [Listeria cossartiae subsp. cayugensis]
MSHIKKYAPRRRFEKFSNADDWEQRKLGDHAKYRRGSFPQPYGNKEWYDGEGAMPFVQVVDVTSKLTLVENTKQKISKLAQPKSVFVPKGKVIVTLQGSIGRVAITQYDSFVDRTLLIFDDYEKETDERFWAYTIQKKFEIEKLKAPGGTIKTITKEALSSFDVHLPQFEEQQKIGILFKQLDDTIALHQRKLEKIKALKTAYLSEMFPAEGETKPKRRFGGFTDDWEQGKLEELAAFSKGSGYTKNDLVEKGMPLVLYGRLYTKYETIITEVNTFTKMKDKSVISKGNEVVVPSSGETAKDISRASVIGAEGFILGGDLNIIKPKRELNSIFLALTISNGEQQKEIIKRAQGKSVVHVYNTDLKQVKLSYPTFNEQEKIGSFFRQLDNAIALHQRKLQKLQNIKKAYLNEMFI